MIFNFPTEAVSAVIGYQGSKIRDIQLKSGAQVQIIPKDAPLSDACITGSNYQCYLAVRMILHSVSHNRASQAAPPSDADFSFNKDHSLQDVATIFTEIYYRK